MTGPVFPGERVDVVDENDVVIDTVTRAAMRAGNLRHRAVYLAVLSSDGRLLVHQRAAHKDVFPSAWDVAVGGVVCAGEAYDDAAVRELREELGIDAPLEAVDDAGLVYADERVAVVGRVYIVRHDGPFSFDDGEVVQAHFVDRSQLDRMLDTEQWCPDSRAEVVPRIRPLLASGPSG